MLKGVIERVPEGEKTTWYSRMVIQPKKNGTARRTVDLSYLSKHGIEDDENERRSVNTMLYNSELSNQNFNKARTVCSLKNNLELDACALLFQDSQPGCVQEMLKRFKIKRKLEIFLQIKITHF